MRKTHKRELFLPTAIVFRGGLGDQSERTARIIRFLLCLLRTNLEFQDTSGIGEESQIVPRKRGELAQTP